MPSAWPVAVISRTRVLIKILNSTSERTLPCATPVSNVISAFSPSSVAILIFTPSLLENRVILVVRCVAVKENILRKFLEFKEVRVSEIGCRPRCVISSWGEDTAESDEGLAREESYGSMKRLVAGAGAVLLCLCRDWWVLVGQICCKKVSCSGLLPWMSARQLHRRVANQGDCWVRPPQKRAVGLMLLVGVLSTHDGRIWRGNWLFPSYSLRHQDSIRELTKCRRRKLACWGCLKTCALRRFGHPTPRRQPLASTPRGHW
jgi:hypothetical protein